MNNVKDTEFWILKYKSAKWTDEAIARKLNITPEEVGRRWDAMIEKAKLESSNGSMPLAHQLTVMAYQYQLVGESLKVVASALSNEASFEEIRAEIDNDKEASAARLQRRFIVLRPFQFEDVEASLQESLKRQALNS